MHKLPYVSPIVGGRKVEQLKENIAALDISLTPEQVMPIEQASPFDPGFPNDFIVGVPLAAVIFVPLASDGYLTPG